MLFFRQRAQKVGKEIARALKNSLIIEEEEFRKRRWVIFSDLHKGNKSTVDDFRNNELIFFYALKDYLQKDFSLVLNGDIEECWSFNLEKVINSYQTTIFKLEREFNLKGNNYYVRLVGNHDRLLLNSEYRKKLEHFLGAFSVYEALLLGENIIVLHGHQGEFISTEFEPLSIFFNRFFWKPLQKVSGVNIEGWARNYFKQNQRDMLLFDWAKKNRKILIAGHTHRAIFNSQSEYEKLLKIEQTLLKKPSDDLQRLLLPEVHKRLKKIRRHFRKPLFLDLPCYFNSGSGVYRNGLTAIEIEAGEIKLVKWEYSDGVVEDQFVGDDFAHYLKIVRKVLEKDRLELLLLASAF